MSLAALALSLLFGGLVGVVSGLVGVGGGIVMVPLLYFLFANPAWSGIVLPASEHAVVAHATSLFVIVPTALAGIRAYHREGQVEWGVALPMAGTAILAAVGGVQLAVRLPPEVLKSGFGLFLVGSGIQLLLSSRAKETTLPPGRRSLKFAVAGGLLVGLITALLGVGGGIVAIPILIYLVGLDVKKVAATSLGIVVFSAVTAAGTYALAGWGRPGMPPGSFGFIFLPAGLALLPGAIMAARLGVAINRRLNPSALKVLFGAVFLIVGARLFLVSTQVALP